MGKVAGQKESVNIWSALCAHGRVVVAVVVIPDGSIPCKIPNLMEYNPRGFNPSNTKTSSAQPPSCSLLKTLLLLVLTHL